MEFAGRSADIGVLNRQLAAVTAGRGGSRGRAVIVTGRRRVGKSRLAQEFCDRSGVPYVIFQATRGRNPRAERADFTATIAQSSLPGAELVGASGADDWNQALIQLAVAAPADTPSIVVIDEVPWLVEQDGEFEGALQTVWDRRLSRKPILLLLIGSDMSVMVALQSHQRPFFGRAATMAVQPLNLADVQSITRLDPAGAVDAFLITGGFPEIVTSWRPGARRSEFLRDAVSDPLSPLLAAGQLTMLGEFPDPSNARAVLESIGSGERTFSAIAAAAGGGASLPSGTLTPVLAMLRQRNAVAADRPLSTVPDTRNTRYRIADTYLRFWLALLQRSIPLIERGRGDIALERIERSWPTWRGRAVEPLVRESLIRLMPDADWPQAEAVGGWWNRQNNPEVDLVGADRAPVARQVLFVGSVKWLDRQSFGRRDYDALARALPAVPGTTAETKLVAVSRSGVRDDLPLAVHWGPDDLVRAWARPFPA